MRVSRRDLMLMCAAVDRTFTYGGGRLGTWVGKCIHCRRKLGLDADGTSQGTATLEHITPRTHGGTNTLDNLAIACARCNTQKGRKLDILPLKDARLQNVIRILTERRLARLRPIGDHGCPRLSTMIQRGVFFEKGTI